jgi:peptide/nickel transport system substrate-binding protein
MVSLSSLKKIYSHYKDRIIAIYTTLSPERVIFFWVGISLGVVFLFFATTLYLDRFLSTVPEYGGELREGIIGTPRFINPVLAITDQDKDLTGLVFAGLTKKDSEGHVILNIAESITESDDKLRYDVTLKHNAYFHDGEKVTADDILYTVGLVQNPLIKSPHAIEWEGVSVEKESGYKITFVLKRPFPLFMHTLTLGILPKHIWKNLTEEQFALSDYNIHAIGAGPYRITDIQTDSGIPTVLTLHAHKRYTLGRPYIDTVIVSTYQNEKYLLKAFDDSDINRIHAISPEKALALATSSKSVRIETSLLPRTFAVFFNPNKNPALADKSVRRALELATNKKAIIEKVLHGYGKVVNDPYPFDENTDTHVYSIENARTELEKSKQLKNASSSLSITLATANTEEMKTIAAMIKEDWAKIGVEVTITVYEVSDLNQSVIKDRDFQALLFGTITQNPSDLYAFWHSTQRTYPGLNISNYVSKNLDANLETLRESDDELTRLGAYENIKKEFAEEVPGIFLYAPALIYVTNDTITSPLPRYSFDNASRFTLVEGWYKYSDRVWPTLYYKPLVQFLENMIH